MKKNAVLVVSVALLLIMVLVNTILAEHEHKGKPSNAEIMQKTQKLQMPFIANEGQIDERVAFYAKTFGGMVFVTKDGDVVYSLPRVAHASSLGHDEINKGKTGYTGLTGYRGNEGRCIIHRALCTLYPYCTWNFPGYYSETSSLICHSESNSPVCHSERSEESHVSNSPSTRRDTDHRVPTTAAALKEEFIGAKVLGIKGEGESITKVSYFKGNDPSRWKTNIATYDVVNLGEIYKGIELKLKAHGDNVEKLLYVKPGAVPEQIKISLSGLKPSGCKGKQPPESPFSKGDFADIPLNKGGEGVVFLGNEERIPETSPLIKGIQGLWVNEHGELVAETELGPVKFTKPMAYQEIDGKRVDVECGYVISDCGIHESSDEGWVKRRSPNKNGLNGLNPLKGLDGFDLLNPSYPCQLTSQPAYGFKVASYDRTKDLIIDPLLASTYLGGTHNETGYSITLDTSGNVYVTGYTKSTDFPTTDGAYDTYGYSGPSYDVFVSKLDSGLTSLLASTYLGGALNDYGLSLALDTSDNVYVMGYTEGGFPTTDDAFNTDFNGYDYYDVFVSKLDSGLTNLLASTYLGGFDSDYGYSLALDTSGNVYVTGYTESSDFPTTGGAYDTSFNGGDNDVFVSKLDSGLTSLLSSTYLGGSDSEGGFFIALDTSGNVYVTGNTKSSDFPTTGGAYDTSRNSSNDVFVSKLNGGLTNLLASTYMGGSDRDYGNSLTFDTSGNVYVTGNTYSSDFPTTGGAYDTSRNSSNDVFVSKLDSGLTSLLASTYLGGSSYDNGYFLTLDSSGHVYVTGSTYSADFPTTSGAYDTSYNGGDYDVFVSKMNGGLTNLLASTYLGGGSGYALGNDSGHSLSLDTSGNVYVTGDTSSSDFPTTGGAYDTSYNTGYFGYYDAFVSKFDSTLSGDTVVTPTPTPTPSNIFTIQPGPEGKDTCYGTVYARNGTPDAETLYMGGWGDWYYDFFEFDLTDSPSADETVSATLYLYGNAPYDGSDPAFKIYKITQSWTESGVTYSDNPLSVYYKDFGPFAISSSAQWNSVDITDMYKAWKNGTYPNYGIELVPTNNNHSNGSIYSSDNTNSSCRPKIIITKSSAATPTPTPIPQPSPTQPPIVTTGAATNITSSSATLNGTVNANGLTTTAWFEYGKSSGSYSSKSSTQSISGTSNTPISIGISGLLTGTTYFYNLVAQNSAGTIYGKEMSFTTTSTEEEDILKKHAPILYMHGQERFHPTNVKVMLDNSELYEKKCKKEGKTGTCKKYEGAQVLDNKDKKLSLAQLMDEYNDNVYYLQLKKEAKKKVKKDWKERQTVYARQTTDTDEGGKEKTILQYWFFYVYNDWGTEIKLGNTHEGDWEMIQIILREDEQKNKQPEKITYSYHHGGQTFGWDEVNEDGDPKVNKKGDHPVIYITLGGHGCWNSPGDHIWYQYQEKVSDCWKCTDKTDDDGDVLYPNSMSNSEISEIQSSFEKDSYTIEDMTDWIYWKGYWGKQAKNKMNGGEDYGSSGPQSPPYIDYIEVKEGEKGLEGRWYEPIKWADAPRSSDYTLCNSDNSKVVINYLESNSGKFSDYCNWTSDLSCDNVCSNLRIIYSEEDLVFDVYSLDGKEVDLKISRHKRKGEIYEVEFNSLEIPRNGKASLTFSPDQNPSLEIGIDHDMDGLFDSHRLPDYFEIK